MGVQHATDYSLVVHIGNSYDRRNRLSADLVQVGRYERVRVGRASHVAQGIDELTRIWPGCCVRGHLGGGYVGVGEAEDEFAVSCLLATSIEMYECTHP